MIKYLRFCVIANIARGTLFPKMNTNLLQRWPAAYVE